MKYIDVSDKTSHRVVGIRRIKRKLIVLHTTMGYNSLKWLQGGSADAGRPASSDFLIDRVGNIYQITKPGWYSFHSGTARWRFIQDPGYNLNQSAVGIEIEAAEHKGQKITDLQYIALAALVKKLVEYHDIMIDAVVTHAQVALPPGRKQDPKYFDGYVMAKEMAYPSKESADLVFPEFLP